MRFAALQKILNGMAHHLKTIALAAGLLLIALIGLGYLNNGISTVSEEVKKGSLSVEARQLLFSIKQVLDQNFEKRGHFPDDLGPVPIRTLRYGAGFLSVEGKTLWWGVADMQHQISEFCPDCRLGPMDYKMIAIGNIDADPDLDVWVQSSTDKHPVHIRAD